jgi:polyisoprenoid-binding protein YceI
MLKFLPSTAAFVLCLALAPAAWAQTRAVDMAKSKLAFVYTVDQKITVEGRFPKFAAQVAFDEKQPEKGSVKLEIDLAAIDTGNGDGDTEAKRPLWFDVAKFPKAAFVSSAIRKAGAGYEAAGKVTIKGKTRDALAPFTVAPASGGGLTATGKLVIKRLLFDVGTGQWADVTQIADDVEVRFTLVLGPQK